MRELALHIIDIAENSVSAGADHITILIVEDQLVNRLLIQITDNGKGMDAKTIESVIDPFTTSRTTRKVGLGIPLLKAAAEACNGELSIESAVGKGTTISVEFDNDHIDRMPLGRLDETFLGLLIGHPEVNWIFDYKIKINEQSEREFVIDDTIIKEAFQGLPLTDPTILEYLQDLFTSGINEIQGYPDIMNYN